MGGAIAPTVESLCRHGMIIHITCKQCGRDADILARSIRTEKNRNENFRHLPYRCACGGRRVEVYAYPPDWYPT